MPSDAALADAEPPRPRGARAIPLVAVLAAGVVLGAASLAFLCDDAFITFRHVANARDGHGLVWNAPPFHPVEGYTGFAWALLLWGVWAATGVEPPDAANPLSIALGVATFVLVAVALLRVRARDGRPVPLAVAAVAMVVLGSNHTFLQWLTGGLETALFNGAFAAWVLLAFRAPARRGPRWLAAWSGAAALAALTRPDGLLLVAATMAVATLETLQRRRPLRATAVALLPLAAVAAHVAWRRAFYGEWLPNTYFAKVTAPWPEAGWRYLYCFVIEHGTWWWALLAAAWLVVAARRGELVPRALWGSRLPALAAVAATAVHVGYYTLRVGGDHFEYRVLSHLVPLAVVSAAAMAAALSVRAALPLAALLGLGVTGSVGWLHEALVEQQPPPAYTPLGARLPAWAQPLVRGYDRDQAWLHLQFVGMRCSEHARALADLDRHLPAARTRVASDGSDVPIVMSPAVGLLAWRLPDVAVLDLLGLCDRVVARSPAEANAMAYLPPEALRRILATADADGDGATTAAELTAGIVAATGYDVRSTEALAEVLVFVFAGERPGALTPADGARLVELFTRVRFIAHERRAPPDYVQALDPNVTIVDRRPVVRRREPPLTPERVRSIEREWWQRVNAR